MELEKIEFVNELPISINIKSITKYPIHYHKDITEIILPIKGSVRVKANFEQIFLQEGEFFFINNKTIHSIKSDDEAIVLIFHIDLKYFQEQFPYIKNMFFRNDIHEDLLGKNKITIKSNENFKIQFRNLLISICSENFNKSSTHLMFDKLIHKLIYQMVYEFNWLQLIKYDGEFISSTHLDRYHRIVQFIDENYSKKIHLDDIVEMEFITKTYFSHFWKNLSTYSFGERINYERILKSEFFLFKDMTITDISNKCGFSDVKYYYRNFKKWYGCMPLEHRKKSYEYEKSGYKYEDINFYDIKRLFDLYVDNFFSIDNILEENMDFSSLIDKYLYLKYYHTIHNKSQTITRKFLTLDPFKYAVLNEDNSKIKYNWTVLDLLMNLVIDFEFTLQIKLNDNKIKKDLFYEYIIDFLENSIDRYGIKSIKNSHFLIDYKYSINLHKEQTIEELISKLIDNPTISYYIEA